MLPNNGNVIMSAEQAADHSSKLVARRADALDPGRARGAGRVRPDSRCRGERGSDGRGGRAAVATGAVTIATRDVQLNGVAVESGKWLGLADGEPVAGGETFDEVAHAVLERLLREPRDVVTLLTGDEPPALDGLLARIRAEHPDARARGARRRPAALSAPAGS